MSNSNIKLEKKVYNNKSVENPYQMKINGKDESIDWLL